LIATAQSAASASRALRWHASPLIRSSAESGPGGPRSTGE
jgi:hypothetical protein